MTVRVTLIPGLHANPSKMPNFTLHMLIRNAWARVVRCVFIRKHIVRPEVAPTGVSTIYV